MIDSHHPRARRGADGRDVPQRACAVPPDHRHRPLMVAGDDATARRVDGKRVEPLADRDTRADGAGRRVEQKDRGLVADAGARSEEHTSELQSLMRISYAVFCLKKKKKTKVTKLTGIIRMTQQRDKQT